MNQSKSAKWPILAWMPPGASRRQQILTVALVPLQPGIPMGLHGQVMDQQACKVHYLLEKEMAEEPAAKDDLLNRLDSMGLLPEEAKEPGMSLWELCKQLVDGNSKLRAYIRPRTEKPAKDTYVAGNKLVMNQRDEELRKRLQELLNNLDSGIGHQLAERKNPGSESAQIFEDSTVETAKGDGRQDELVEVPGARELYESLTMYQWLDALDEEVGGR